MLPALGVFGISGVGKTTLIRRYIAERAGIIATSGGRLLQEIKGKSGEELRQSAGVDIDDSQVGLIDAFRKFREANANQRVIFDGHTVIDSDTGIAEIPSDVIVGLLLNAIVFVSDTPDRIALRRHLDTSRPRPMRAVEVLAQHQELAHSLAQAYAKNAGIPFADVTADDLSAFRKIADRELGILNSTDDWGKGDGCDDPQAVAPPADREA